MGYDMRRGGVDAGRGSSRSAFDTAWHLVQHVVICASSAGRTELLPNCHWDDDSRRACSASYGQRHADGDPNCHWDDDSRRARSASYGQRHADGDPNCHWDDDSRRACSASYGQRHADGDPNCHWDDDSRRACSARVVNCSSAHGIARGNAHRLVTRAGASNSRCLPAARCAKTANLRWGRAPLEQA